MLSWLVVGLLAAAAVVGLVSTVPPIPVSMRPRAAWRIGGAGAAARAQPTVAE